MVVECCWIVCYASCYFIFSLSLLFGHHVTVGIFLLLLCVFFFSYLLFQSVGDPSIRNPVTNLAGCVCFLFVSFVDFFV